MFGERNGNEKVLALSHISSLKSLTDEKGMRTMRRDEAKEYLLAHPDVYLRKDGSGKGYVCPLCGSGSGKNGTGLSSRDGGRHWKCFACNFYGDVIDLIAAEHGIKDGGSREAFEAAERVYGLTVDGVDRETKPLAKKNVQATEKRAETDYTEYFRKCVGNIRNTGYLERRGIGQDIAERFGVGFDEAVRCGGVCFPGLIIPTGKHSYIARNTSEELSDIRFRNFGKIQLFNSSALYETGAVFIVEGAIDAMSIAEVGRNAVALNSTSNVPTLIQTLKDRLPKARPLLLALDNDDAGRKAQDDLERELLALGIPCAAVQISGKHKDPNAALLADRERFATAVQNAEESAPGREAYLKTSAAGYFDEFVAGIITQGKEVFIPTGFPKLDQVLNGGLSDGLYCVGAISSLGKTTFCLQIADQIACAGQNVLIFSLEMARDELMAKSVSRLTATLAEAAGEMSMAKSQVGITAGTRYKHYSKDELLLITAACEGYKGFSDKIFIREGVGDLGVEQIREELARYSTFFSSPPVVVVDYLQILAPSDPRMTDKQNTDKAVLELKRLSRDYKMPVIAISSFNRDGYKGKAAMQSFKESGAIEYSSDVLLGFQLAEIEEGDLYTALSREPRAVELKILKNRRGKTGETIRYDYFPRFNLFKEI